MAKRNKDTKSTKHDKGKIELYGQTYNLIAKEKRGIITQTFNVQENETIVLEFEFWDKEDCKVFKWCPSWQALRNMSQIALAIETYNSKITGYTKEVERWQEFGKSLTENHIIIVKND